MELIASQLIKLYVTNKIKDPTLDKTKFINLIIKPMILTRT